MTTRRPDYSGRFRELVAALAVKQRWIEFAISQIARAAKDDEIKWLDLDNAWGHNASIRWLRSQQLGAV